MIKGGILGWDGRLARFHDEIGEEIADRVTVETPFALEFAGADGCGVRLAGQLLMLDFRFDDGNDADNELYSFVVAEAAPPDSKPTYVSWRSAVEKGANAMELGSLKDFARVRHVAYLREPANLERVLDPGVSALEKSPLLADLAVSSLTAATYAQGTDGIQYLIDALALGVQTPLTPTYHDAVLRLAGGAQDLATARLWLAGAKGLA